MTFFELRYRYIDENILQQISEEPVKCILEQSVANTQTQLRTRKPLTSSEAANTRLGSFLSRQGHISTHNHFCSVRCELRHVCYWQVLIFADSALIRFSCRELYLCMAIREGLPQILLHCSKKKKGKRKRTELWRLSE